MVKNLPANARDTRDTGLVPGSGRSPGIGNCNPLQYSCLENSRQDRGTWWAIACSLVTQSCATLWPHGLQPTRLLCPWVFSRWEYWAGLPCPPTGDLSKPGVEPRSPALQADSLPSEPPGKPKISVGISVGWVSGLPDSLSYREARATACGVTELDITERTHTATTLVSGSKLCVT